MKIRLLSEKESVPSFPLPEIVALVERAYRLDAEGKAEVPTKIGVHPEHANSFLHAMPAWVNGVCALGMKRVSYFPGNFDRGLPDSTGIIILNDPDMACHAASWRECTSRIFVRLLARPSRRSISRLTRRKPGPYRMRGARTLDVASHERGIPVDRPGVRFARTSRSRKVSSPI